MITLYNKNRVGVCKTLFLFFKVIKTESLGYVGFALENICLTKSNIIQYKTSVDGSVFVLKGVYIKIFFIKIDHEWKQKQALSVTSVDFCKNAKNIHLFDDGYESKIIM